VDAAGTLLAVAAGEEAQFFDLRKPGAAVGTYTTTHSEDLTCVRLRGQHALTGAEDGLMAVFDTRISGEDEALVTVLPTPGAQGVRSCGFFGPGGGGVWGVSATSGLSLWSVSTGNLVADFAALPAGCRSAGAACDFLVGCFFDEATGALTCAGGADDCGAVTVFNVRKESAAPVGQLPAGAGAAGHTDSLRCVDWIPAPAGSAGALAGCVTGGEDGRLCLWGAAPSAWGDAGAAGGPFVIDAGKAVARTGRAGKARRPAGREDPRDPSRRLA